MTIRLLRSISCISVSEKKREKKVAAVTNRSRSCNVLLQQKQRKRPRQLSGSSSEAKDNIWKTFSQAVDDEQELMRRLYQDNLDLIKTADNIR